jgi:hypothetical protein
VRAASNGDNSGRWKGLSVKRRRRWRSDGNWRGGGIFGGGSRRGGRVGGREGEEVELGRATERSEAPTTSPNQWVHGGRMREKWGVGSGVPCRGKETGERGGGPGRGGRQRGAGRQQGPVVNGGVREGEG